VAYFDQLGNPERGKVLIEKGLETFPDHANLIFTKAYFAARERRYDDARALYEHALTLRNAASNQAMVDDEIFEWKAAYNLASTFLKEERVEEAIPWLEAALRNKPGSAYLGVATARAYERVERWYDAERIYRALYEANENEGIVPYVNFLLRRRRFARAIELVEREQHRFAPQTIAALNNAMAAIADREGLGDPEQFARRALSVAPGDGEALAFLERYYERHRMTEKLDELRAHELDAPCIKPADFSRRAYRLLALGRPADALVAARGGLVLAPRDAVLRYDAALALARLGRDDEAREELAAIEEGAEEIVSTSRLLLAQIERRAGRTDAARAAYDAALALVPDHLEALLGRASIAEAEGRNAEAEADYQAAARSGDRRAAVALAALLIRQGRLSEAGTIAADALTA
jgi:tetratricopeptide (TPR) repeat protein